MRTVQTSEGAQDLDIGIYATPLLPDFAMTHQWLRELRQWNGRLRMSAVVFKIPDDEPVWVGPYSQPKVEITAAESTTLFEANPWGNEVLITNDVEPSNLEIRRVRQDVGWQDMPGGHVTCVCPGCLQRGHPRFMRRLNAAYREALASTELWRAEAALERARGRLPVERLLRHIGSEPQQVATMLHWFKWVDAEQPLRTLLMSPDEAVRASAARSVLRALPLREATLVLNTDDRPVALEVCQWLAWQEPTPESLGVLSDMAEQLDPSVRSKAERTLADLRDDEE